MNIVKGVADLIRRTSSGHNEEFASGSQAQRLSLPGPKIRFSEIGVEGVLKTLWDRCEKAADKVEKRRSFLVFLKQFLAIYKNWEPENYGQLSEAASTSNLLAENSSHSDDMLVGCFAGHPAEVILALVEEVKQVTALVTELKTSTMRSTTEFSCPSASLNITSEGFPVLDALKIVARSLHNCRVFGYYGGIQKLTALMKGSVVQLKAISGALSADENLSSLTLERISLLQQILVYVVSIIFSFIDLNSNVYENTWLYGNTTGFDMRGGPSQIDSYSSTMKVSSEIKINWHQKAVVSMMEAGGLNWLVELLRVIRRLSMKEQRTDLALHYFTLRVLHLALFENPRGQSHFKSIGGLEVLLDSLGTPLNSHRMLENREENSLLNIFQLHVLSLEVLREAVFTNISNLQFLWENGRVQKFANSFCSLAVMLQEYKLQAQDLAGTESESTVTNQKSEPSVALPTSGSYSQCWSDYVVNLSRVLCSFLLAPEDIRPQLVQTSSAGRTSMSVSSVYGELSVKWVTRVLHTVFQCLKACSNQNVFPVHLRAHLQNLSIKTVRPLKVNMLAQIFITG